MGDVYILFGLYTNDFATLYLTVFTEKTIYWVYFGASAWGRGGEIDRLEV